MMRIFRTALLLLTVALAGALTVAVAQPLSADEVLENMEREAQELGDATFLLTGRLVDGDGTTHFLEVDTSIMPGEELVRAEIWQPDALADNVIIFDENVVYNYIFLTNQVSVFRADDPDALGGLIGSEEGAVEFTFDLGELFDGWDTEVTDYQDGVYRLEFTNLAQDAAIASAVALVDENGWVPMEIYLHRPGGGLLAELIINDFEANVGLSEEDLTWYPSDAEVIDERD